MANNARLFVVMVVTAVISHILTLSMMPSVGPTTRDQLRFQKLTFRGQARTKNSNQPAPASDLSTDKQQNSIKPKLSALAQLLAGVSTQKPPEGTLPTKKDADSVVQELSQKQPIDLGDGLNVKQEQQNRISDVEVVVKPDAIPPNQQKGIELKTIASTEKQIGSSGSSLTKKNDAESVVHGSKKGKPIHVRGKPKDSNVKADSPGSSLQEKINAESVPEGSQQRKSISLWGKPKDKNLITNVAIPTKGTADTNGTKTTPFTKVVSKHEKSNLKMAPLSESKWIGDEWHPPPGGTLYDLAGLRKVFQRFNILWLGDEAFHYTYITLLRILSSKRPDLGSVFMKRLIMKPCTTDTSLAACSDYKGASLDYAVVNCFMEMRDLIENRNVSKYKVVIVDFGEQEMLGNCPFVISSKQKMFADIAHRVSVLPTNVAWTTLAWQDSEVVGINNHVIHSLEKGGASHVTVFDFAAGMRLHNGTIDVNLKRKRVDYSVPARVAYVQMLANHLAQHFPDT